MPARAPGWTSILSTMPMGERPTCPTLHAQRGDRSRFVLINLEPVQRLCELLTSGSVVFVTERFPVHTPWRGRSLNSRLLSYERTDSPA